MAFGSNRSKAFAIISQSTNSSRRFCLDANLSYKTAEALALVEEPVIHVVKALPQFAGPVPGNCSAPDEKIAEWCGATSHVLVTIDTDFIGRWIHSRLLATYGVEVIVFDRDLKGLPEQHRRVTAHLPHWQYELGRQPYAFRVWEQGVSARPRLREGKKRRQRARMQPAGQK